MEIIRRQFLKLTAGATRQHRARRPQLQVLVIIASGMRQRPRYNRGLFHCTLGQDAGALGVKVTPAGARRCVARQ